MSDLQSPALTKPLADIEFTQKRGHNKTHLKFGEDELAYSITEKNGSASFQAKYHAISGNRDFFIERNTWLQSVGVLWIVLGALFTAVNVAADKPSLSIWLPVGVACWLWAHFRTTRYTKIPTDSGTLYIIDDAQKDRILAELEARRVNQLRRWYDFLSPDEEPDKQRARFHWLHKQGALSDTELEQRLATLELQFAETPVTASNAELLPTSDPNQRRLLN
jgi:hypothetical protein